MLLMLLGWECCAEMWDRSRLGAACSRHAGGRNGAMGESKAGAQ